jgi:hypothetical protein
MRQLLLITALISTGLLPGGEPAEANAAARPAAMAPVSHVAVDSALLDAVRAEFPQSGVRIRIAPARISDAGPLQREVSARGHVLLADDADWIPFQVTALYDIDSGSATTTALDLEADPVATTRLATPDLSGKLRAAASRKLREEFTGQPAEFELARVQVREAGDYLAVLADGKADFGVEGAADATVRALYDPRNGQWLRVDYDLGEGG